MLQQSCGGRRFAGQDPVAVPAPEAALRGRQPLSGLQLALQRRRVICTVRDPTGRQTRPQRCRRVIDQVRHRPHVGGQGHRAGSGRLGPEITAVPRGRRGLKRIAEQGRQRDFVAVLNPNVGEDGSPAGRFALVAGCEQTLQAVKFGAKLCDFAPLGVGEAPCLLLVVLCLSQRNFGGCQRSGGAVVLRLQSGNPVAGFFRIGSAAVAAFDIADLPQQAVAPGLQGFHPLGSLIQCGFPRADLCADLRHLGPGIGHGLIQPGHFSAGGFYGAFEFGKGRLGAFAGCLQLAFFPHKPVQYALRVADQIGFADLILFELAALIGVDVEQALDLRQIAVEAIAADQKRLQGGARLGFFLLQIGQIGRQLDRGGIGLGGARLGVCNPALGLYQRFFGTLGRAGLRDPLQIVQLRVEPGHALAQATVFLRLLGLTFQRLEPLLQRVHDGIEPFKVGLGSP